MDFVTSLGYCPGCDRDPGVEIGAEETEPLSPPPSGCISTEEIERTFINDARRIRTLIKNVGDPGTDYHMINAVAKLYEVRIKILRAAGECARAREHEEIVERRDRRDRAMQQAAKAAGSKG